MGMNLKVACSKGLHQLISVIAGAKAARETKDIYDPEECCKAVESLIVQEITEELARGSDNPAASLRNVQRKQDSLKSLTNLSLLWKATEWTDRGEVVTTRDSRFEDYDSY